MIDLAQSLERLPYLVSLKLADCCFQGGRLGPVRSQLDIEGYNVLGKALSQHPNIRELDLSKNYFQGQGFPYLLRGVAEMQALAVVTMGATPIQFQDLLKNPEIKACQSSHAMEVLLICLALRRNRHLRVLDLSQVAGKLSLATVRSLVDSLQQLRAEGCAPLSRLSLQDGVELPLQQLEEGTIETWDLSSESRVERDALAPLLVFALERSRHLTEFDLRNNDFGQQAEDLVDAVLALATRGGLSRYNGLPTTAARCEKFSVERQPVMSHGICVFAATFLARVSGLQSLDLQNAGLEARGLSAVFSSLLQLQSVTSLDISDQPLRKAGMQQLCSFLRADKKLQSLRAYHVSMPSHHSAEMVDFAKAMETNSTLVTLDVRGNTLHPEVAERLRRTMEEKRSTVPLDLDAKICFLLCNRRLPGHLQLPEVSQVFEASRLYTGGAQSPLFMIFQFCGQPRQLLLSPTSRQPPDSSAAAYLDAIRRRVRGLDPGDDDDSPRSAFSLSSGIPEHEIFGMEWFGPEDSD